MSSIKFKVQEMNHFFYSHQTLPIEKRLYYLKKLKKVILNYQKEIAYNLYLDFKKPTLETYMTEIYTAISEINTALSHLKKWTKPKYYAGVLPILGGYTKVLKEPYGVCVIFSPYNYPFCLAINPLVGAIAAGNCAIIKPSEHTPYTNGLLKRILKEVFPPYYVCTIEGDVKVAQELLNEPIDYIFFTGGTQAAKKVMQTAANHLVPVTLELGGKSPTIITKDADITLAAQRIIWGKFLNAGQTCIAPDYVLVQKQIAQSLLRTMKSVLHTFYKNPKKEMTHIINEAQYLRLLQLINEDKIYYGGHFDTQSLYIEPTILYPIDESDLCMQEEIFGPILPIIPYDTLEDAIKFIQRRPKPLATYIFSQSKQKINYLLKNISFGGGCINDTILHSTHPKAPFGGVGYSGLGAYHGYYSFKTFSHEKTIFVSKKEEIIHRNPTSKPLAKVMKLLIR